MLGDSTSSSESDIESKDEKVYENDKETEASNASTPSKIHWHNSNEAPAVVSVELIEKRSGNSASKDDEDTNLRVHCERIERIES